VGRARRRPGKVPAAAACSGEGWLGGGLRAAGLVHGEAREGGEGSRDPWLAGNLSSPRRLGLGAGGRLWCGEEGPRDEGGATAPFKATGVPACDRRTVNVVPRYTRWPR
jgi:hypothetical protein